MRQVFVAGAGFVAGVGFTTMIATDFQPDVKVLASEVARGVVRGIILGSGVEPYQSKLTPDFIEWRMAASGPTTRPYSVADE
jgi:hypothetical protein